MTSKWTWLLSLLTRRLWFRATLISLLAVLSALIAFVVAPYIPENLSASIGAEAVDSILTIIASSMLAVTTFSLSTMVAAYAAATANVTPRAIKLLIEDTTTQNVLATFVGSFLYSLVAIIALSTGAYGERGRVVLFVVTIAVVLLIVVTLLRWIDYLITLGRVGETTEAVEEAAAAAVRERRARPYLSGVPLASPHAIPAEAWPVGGAAIGYVQHIDMAAIEAAAKECGAKVFLLALPGTFIDARRPIAMIAGTGDGLAREVADAITIGRERSFDQDPRFGMQVLAEIASRALSPALNDPGTAIDVLGRAVRLLTLWDEPVAPEEIRYSRVYVPALDLGELFDDVFAPIGRDGAGMLEVQIRLQKALASLARLDEPGFRAHALRHSRLALARANVAMTLTEDREILAAAAMGVVEAGETR